MSKELIERLRKDYHPKRPPLFDEAADTIEQQQSWIASLEQNARDADRMYKELETELAEQQKRIDELETQVDQLQWENKGIAEWREIALAAQAQIKVLRDCIRTVFDDVLMRDELYEMCEKALAQPTDTSALRELLKAERERCAKVCEEEAADPHNVPAAIVARRCAESIRAMEGQ